MRVVMIPFARCQICLGGYPVIAGHSICQDCRIVATGSLRMRDLFFDETTEVGEIFVDEK